MLVRVCLFTLHSASLSSVSLIRRWHCRQRRKASVARCRFFCHPVFVFDQALALARSQLVSAIGQTCSICYSSWAYHLCHASCILCHILFCTDRTIPRLVDG